MPADPLPQMTFATPAAWTKWLAKHHLTSKGIWLQIAKKPSGIRSVTYAEALEAALCQGWIDGQKQKHDESYWLQKFTPRGRRSLWSQVNRTKVLDLIERELMQPAGHAVIEAAKTDGRWEAAYAPQSSAEVPPDLAAALKKKPAAGKFFATLDRPNRYAILFRLQTAKKPETRSARLEKFVGMLERGEKIHAVLPRKSD